MGCLDLRDVYIFMSKKTVGQGMRKDRVACDLRTVTTIVVKDTAFSLFPFPSSSNGEG